MKVIVVHMHERGEGSTILAILPATPAGRKVARKIKREAMRSRSFLACDVIDEEERDVG